MADEQLVSVIRSACNREGVVKRCPERIAEALQSTGYGRAEEIRKEFARELLGRLTEEFDIAPSYLMVHGIDHRRYTCKEICRALYEIAKEYGVEIE